MVNIWSDHLSPPAATLTEKNLPDQAGKVFIVTGGSSGVGEQLCQMLYQHHGKVYMAARSQEKMDAAIARIQAAVPASNGALIALRLDLADLTTIKASAEQFLAAETQLDVLWLNAGVMTPAQGSTTAQGYELQLGTNNLGHWLFAHFLQPLQAKRAQTAAKDSVRIVWVSSSAAELAPSPPVNMENVDYKKKDEMAHTKYARSKAGNVLHSCEYARRFPDTGVISVALNPGNLKTELQRHTPSVVNMLINLILHPAIKGAYTELFAGLSPEVTAEHNGAWIQPWGRLQPIRKELADPELGKKYWEWTEEQVRPYY